MVKKVPIIAGRIRRVPRRFSWIDHRLIRDRHIEKCTHPAAALYLFLVTVGDAKGLSYYGDTSIIKHLSMDQNTLDGARSTLIRQELIAWQKPLYQVLALDVPVVDRPVPRSRMENPLSLGDILKMAREGGS